MSLIFYGICGEGLGHCNRSLAIIESMPDCRFVVLTYGNAYDYMSQLKMGNVSLIKIEGLRFAEKDGAFKFWGTVKNCVKYLFSRHKNNEVMQSYPTPDLVITDWEPSVAKFARANRIKCISIDSQHKFRFSSPKNLSFFLRAYSYLVAFLCRIMIGRVHHYVVSSFQKDLMEDRANLTTLQSFIRSNLLKLSPVCGDYLVIYARQKEIAKKIIDSIKGSSFNHLPIVCYGSYLKGYSNVQFSAVNSEEFVKDISSCRAVFSTAGTQLIGECCYLGKPICVVPIPGQYEQSVNAVHVNWLGVGVGTTMEDMSPEIVNSFLEKIPTIQRRPSDTQTAVLLIKTLMESPYECNPFCIY